MRLCKHFNERHFVLLYYMRITKWDTLRCVILLNCVIDMKGYYFCMYDVPIVSRYMYEYIGVSKVALNCVRLPYHIIVLYMYIMYNVNGKYIYSCRHIPS